MLMIPDYQKEIFYFAKKDPAPPPPQSARNFNTYSEYKARHPHLFTEEAIEVILNLFNKGNSCEEMQKKLALRGFSMNRNCLAEILSKHSNSYRENGWLISKNLNIINLFIKNRKELKNQETAATKTAILKKITKPTLADILSKAGVKFNFFGYEN